jgi:hypothetical protein
MKPIRTCRPASRNTLPHAPRVGEPDVGPFDLHPTPARAPCLAQRHRPRPLPSLFWSSGRSYSSLASLPLSLSPPQSRKQAQRNATPRCGNTRSRCAPLSLTSPSTVASLPIHCSRIHDQLMMAAEP